MDQKSIDAVNCINDAYTKATRIEAIEPNENFTINKNISNYLGGSWDIPFFHIPRDSPEDYLEMMKSLFNLSAQDKEMQVIDCFVVYVNICRGSFLNLDEEIRRAIRSVGFSITEYDEEETDNWIKAWDETMFDNEEYTGLEIDHAIIQTSIGIYWNFITKRLTNANIEGWLRKRRSA